MGLHPNEIAETAGVYTMQEHEAFGIRMYGEIVGEEWDGMERALLV